MLTVDEVEPVDREALQKVVAGARRFAAPQDLPPGYLGFQVEEARTQLDRAMANLLVFRAHELLKCEEALRTMAPDLESQLDSDGDFDPVIEALETVQASVKTVYENMSVFKAKPVEALTWMVEIVVESSRRIFDLAEALRWSCLEAQADADIRHGRVTGFATSEDAMAHLDRLTKG